MTETQVADILAKAGVVLISPSGTKFQLTVTDKGKLTVTEVK